MRGGYERSLRDVRILVDIRDASCQKRSCLTEGILVDIKVLA
jgi:hypothetical protein